MKMVNLKHSAMARATFFLACLFSCGLFIGTAFGDQSALPFADLTVGDTVDLRLFGVVDGETPQQRVDDATERLNIILARPNLLPSDVVVFNPQYGSPVIYVAGRALIAVDRPSAQLLKIGNQLKTATIWAKQLQQVLPFVDIRLSSLHEPVIPSDPPLQVVSSLDDVGGNVGEIYLNDRLAVVVLKSPAKSLTAAEYGDQISDRITAIVNGAGSRTITLVASASTQSPAEVDLLMNGQFILPATIDEAKAVGQPNAMALAQAWIANLQQLIPNLQIQ